MSRNCSSSDKELAVRWTSQGNEGGWDISLPGELLACHPYLLGWDREQRGLLSSLCRVILSHTQASEWCPTSLCSLGLFLQFLNYYRPLK